MVVSFCGSRVLHNKKRPTKHPTGGSLRVFKQFVWLEAGSGKMALPRPAHQRVTQAVRPQTSVMDKEKTLSFL